MPLYKSNKTEIIAKETPEQKFRKSNFFICSIGYNRTGKSSVISQFIKEWRVQNPGQIVISYDPQKSFESDIEIRPYSFEEDVSTISNCLLVIDDYRGLLTSSRLPDFFKRLLFDRELRNIDIIIVTHSPGQVIPELAYYISDYVIYYTQADKNTFSGRIPNFQDLNNIADGIRNYCSVKGIGSFPNFRFARYNTLTGSVKLSPAIDKKIYIELERKRAKLMMDSSKKTRLMREGLNIESTISRIEG